jgi:hypothetical protein
MNCDEPLAVSSFHRDAGVEKRVKVWHGVLFGDTHARTCTSPVWFVIFAVTPAKPEPLVVALDAESEAVPRVTAKLMDTLACGTPRLSVSTKSWVDTVAP